MIINAESLDESGIFKFTLADCRNVMDDFEASLALVKNAPVVDSVHISQSPWMFNQDGINAGRHPIPKSGMVDSLYKSLKNEDNELILFADANSFFHTRLYYLFRLYGHKSYLWNDTIENLERAMAGRAVENKSIEDIIIQADMRESDADIYRSMEDVKRSIDKSNILLIDVRARKRYLGLEEPIDSKMGHIPGAVNIPTPAIYKNGLIDFDALGYLMNDLKKYGEIIVYCGSGMSATPMFVLLSELGLPVKLYGGSFSEWITDGSNTVETGDTPLNERMSRTHG